MNGHCVSGLSKEDAVVADPEPEKALKFAGQRFYLSHARFRVAMNSLKNSHGDVLRDGSNLSWHFRLEADLLHGNTRFKWLLLFVGTDTPNLLHREAEIGYYLFERNTCAPVAKVLIGGT